MLSAKFRILRVTSLSHSRESQTRRTHEGSQGSLIIAAALVCFVTSLFLSFQRPIFRGPQFALAQTWKVESEKLYQDAKRGTSLLTMRTMPHPDMMFDAMVVWVTLYLLVALVLWYVTVRQRRIAESIRGRKIERLRGGRWWPPNWRSLPSWLLERLDDLYVMEWMERTGWFGKIAKLVAVAFIASPIWILGTLWLVLMGQFILALLGFPIAIFRPFK